MSSILLQDNEGILEAYTKSWTSGALDKAANRNSAAFSLVLHHLSSFIFGNPAGDALKLRNKLAKSLMRDYSRKQQHEVRNHCINACSRICYYWRSNHSSSLSLSSSGLVLKMVIFAQRCNFFGPGLF